MPSDLQVQEIVPSDGVLSDGVLALSMVIELDMTTDLAAYQGNLRQYSYTPIASMELDRMEHGTNAKWN